MALEADRETKPAMAVQVAVEEEIRRAGLRLNFPEELERRYRRDTATARAYELRTLSRIALTVFLTVGILMNLFVFPSPRWKVVVSCWSVTTAVMLLAQLYFRPAIAFLKREAAMFVFCTTVCLSVILLVSTHRSASALQPLLMATLPINFIAIFVRLPFPLIAFFAALTGSAYVAAVLVHPGMPPSEIAFMIAFLLALTLPTLLAAHGQERAARRLYLHSLLQRLNYERVVADNAVLTDLSYTDPLTGVANRRRLEGELQRLCDKEDVCASFLMIDIDWFKGFNDRYGHQVGDRCLQEVATCLAAALRDRDLLARLGGEEFGVLLPALPMQEAVLVAERLRSAVAAYPFMVGTRIVRITVSIGVASIVGFDEPARVVEAADKAMYRAKRAGRNRVGGPWLKLAS